MKSALFRASILALTLSGCALLPERHHLVDLSPYPEKIQLKVPFYTQTDDLCGPAAMAMLLDWNGIEIDLEQLHKQIYTQSLGGSLQQDMLGSARRHGMLAVTVDSVDALLQELNHGTPVLLLLNLGLSNWPEWHYVVVTGFDASSETAFIHDGLTANRELPLADLLAQWYRGERWGLVVTRPDLLPVSADANKLLAAAIGLERVGQHAAAFEAYSGATRKFETSKLLWFGRGNTALTLGKFSEAEQAYRQTIQLNPQHGAAYHNLAAALHNQGQNTEAMAVISAGLEQAGDFRTALEKLDAQIKQSMRQQP